VKRAVESLNQGKVALRRHSVGRVTEGMLSTEWGRYAESALATSNNTGNTVEEYLQKAGQFR